MTKYVFAIFLLLFASTTAFSQNILAQEAYFNFKVNRNAKGSEQSIGATTMLLKMEKDLTLKQVTNVAYHLGRMYEEFGLPDSAIVYYEKSLKGEPDYSVIHRALGFIHLTKTRPIIAMMNEANKTKDVAGNAKAFAQYKTLVQKALPYLEKYQACEPDDETLHTISDLCKSIKDPQRLASLAPRLKTLSGRCVTLLEDD